VGLFGQSVSSARRFLRKEKWRRSKAIRISIAIGLTLILSALFPQGQSQQSVTGYSVGSLWTSADVIAPFSFPLQKDQTRYNRDVRKALEEYYPVYIVDTNAKLLTRDSVAVKLRSVFASLHNSDDIARSKGLSESEIAVLREYIVPSKTAPSEIENDLVVKLSEIIAKVTDTILIASTIPEEIARSVDSKISLRKRTNTEMILPAASLVSTDELSNRLQSVIEQKLRLQPEVRSGLAKIAASIVAPNAIYSAEQSEESRDAIIKRVPRTDGIVSEGQLIIAKGEVITSGAKASLESLAEARIQRGGTGTMIGRILGTVGHVAIIVMLFVLYVKFIRRKIYKDNAQLILISFILIFPALLAFLSVQVHTRFPLEYLILIPVSSMLLTILFDSRTGFYGTVIVALLVAGIRGNDYNVALAGLSAGAFAAYTVRDLRSRSQLFQSIGYIFLGYLIAIAALSFERGAPLTEIGLELIFAAGNALISPVLTFGLVYAVEGLFNTASDLKLTEYDNINHPLLRTLADEAPGTYHHTMLVAQLAENAAIAIGANALLTKVGAYFHDIGKVAQPHDFIENQIADHGNVHDSISAAESAKRVRDHVTRGVTLAENYHLPEKIIDFIPMHHGTLRISFFYQRALESMTAGGVLNDAPFRYPGPKPNTKETAIVMLADASEAIARTMALRAEEPTTEMLEEELHGLFQKRIADGQLDECDLTLHDLVIIRSVFARLLIGTFHSRINYPTTAKVPTANTLS
jgi:putative nucleotidyltransferase with HDIG domain